MAKAIAIAMVPNSLLWIVYCTVLGHSSEGIQRHHRRRLCHKRWELSDVPRGTSRRANLGQRPRMSTNFPPKLISKAKHSSASFSYKHTIPTHHRHHCHHCHSFLDPPFI